MPARRASRFPCRRSEASMTREDPKSDLVDLVHHEHDHLRRLFEDVADSFSKLAGGTLDEPVRSEMLESTSDDLELALDEMLHHFNQEEEVFFVEIERRFPDLADDIAALAEAHELMCERTRWLHRQLHQSDEHIAEHLDDILEVVRQMGDILSEHTKQEDRLFGTALSQMSADERDDLLAEMRRI